LAVDCGEPLCHDDGAGPGAAARACLDRDLVGVQPLAAACAADLGAGELAASAVPQQNRCALLAGRPAISPGHHREQHVHELVSLLGQQVVVPWWALGVCAPFEQAVHEQSLEPFGEHLARDPEVAAQFVEAGYAEMDVAQDQRRPPLAGGVEGARDRTGHICERGSLHSETCESPKGTCRVGLSKRPTEESTHVQSDRRSPGQDGVDAPGQR
jgi:hypothetical protein